MVKTLPSNAGDMGSIPGWELRCCMPLSAAKNIFLILFLLLFLEEYSKCLLTNILQLTKNYLTLPQNYSTNLFTDKKNLCHYAHVPNIKSLVKSHVNCEF